MPGGDGTLNLLLSLNGADGGLGLLNPAAFFARILNLVLVAAHQIIAHVCGILEEIIVRHAPLNVLSRIAELDLVAL